MWQNSVYGIVFIIIIISNIIVIIIIIIIITIIIIIIIGSIIVIIPVELATQVQSWQLRGFTTRPSQRREAPSRFPSSSSWSTSSYSLSFPSPSSWSTSSWSRCCLRSRWSATCQSVGSVSHLALEMLLLRWESWFSPQTKKCWPCPIFLKVKNLVRYFCGRVVGNFGAQLHSTASGNL